MVVFFLPPKAVWSAATATSPASPTSMGREMWRCEGDRTVSACSLSSAAPGPEWGWG